MSNDQLERIKQEILRYRLDSDGGMSLDEMREIASATIPLADDPEVRAVLGGFANTTLNVVDAGGSVLGAFFAPFMLMLLAGMRVNEPAQVER